MDLAMQRMAKVNELANLASAYSYQPLHLDIASTHEAYLGAPYIRFNVFFVSCMSLLKFEWNNLNL